MRNKKTPGLQSRSQRFQEEAVNRFFGGHAVGAIIILLLITLFLFREATGFFPGVLQSHRDHRISGMEFADQLHAIADEGMSLVRWTHYILAIESSKDPPQDTPYVASIPSAWRDFAHQLEAPFLELRTLAIESADAAMPYRERLSAIDVSTEERRLIAETVLSQSRETLQSWDGVRARLPMELRRLLENMPPVSTESGREARRQLTEWLRVHPRALADADSRLREWNPHQPLRWWHSAASFLTGREWVTNSFRQDLYGILPLLAGTLLVSSIALMLAIPFGLGSAFYVTLLASRRERRWMQPAFQFVAAIPPVILGFFGIVYLGETFRSISTIGWLDWLPGFPISERMNAFTAGALLAVMAVPTIFMFASSALKSVPAASIAASYAIGASRLQTIRTIILPGAGPGLLSAVLVAFGRVVGETMIVLLCAGNRVMIPDFTEGLDMVFQPVHTLTGIVAQEMGEVAQGSLHYRSLFLIGVVLFIFCLCLHSFAQWLLRPSCKGSLPNRSHE